MPEVIFTIQLPDGSTKECYSPSSVVCRYFAAGDEIGNVGQRPPDRHSQSHAKPGHIAGSFSPSLICLSMTSRSAQESGLIQVPFLGGGARQ